MAEDSCVILKKSIADCVKTGQLDSSAKDQLDYAREITNNLWNYFFKLVEVNSQNWVCEQLMPLINEANDGFREILSLLKNQGLTSETVKMISEVMKMIKPEIIAERFISPSKQSTSSSTRMITMNMVNLVTRMCSTVIYLANITFREFKHLEVLLKFTAKRCNIEHEKIKDLFTLAEDIAKTATYLYILCWETYDQYSARISAPESSIWVTYKVILVPDFKSKISKLLERINPIRPEWRKLYISFLKASHSSVPLMHGGLKNLPHDLDLAQKFTESIRYDLEKLKSHDASLNVAFSDRFEWLQDGLLHLSEFHKILDRQQQDLSSLLSFLEVLAIEAAIAIYSLCDMDLENNIAEVDLMFLPLQMKFKYLKVEISLFQKLRLPESQMDCFQEELTSMKTFLMDSLDKCKVQTQLTDVLTLVLSVTTEAESFTNSLSRDSEDGELARKINLLHFQLHLKFKFIREAICPFISASSTPVLPVIYPLNFLPTYVEAISSSFTMLKSSKTSPSAGSPTMDEVFMEFHEYVFENLLLKVEADLELTDTDKVKRFYHRLMPLVTLVVDPPMQYIECKKQNGLLRKIGTLAIEAKAAIRLSYEDALDRSKSRKVGLLLQILTASFMLIKCEGKLMDQLKHKAVLETEFLDLVANAHEEIIFLRGFLMDLLRQHTTKLDKSDESFVDGSSTGEISDFLQETEFVEVDASHVLPLVLSVATEAHSFITSLSRDSEERELMSKINILHFQLLLKFKFIKAAIRQICPSFSASSTPDHHVIYPLNFLPTYFEVIDSYFTKLKSSSGSPKMDEVFLRFHELIFENLLLKDEADLKLTDSDKLKRFYLSLLLLLTLLFDPPTQYIECKKQNNLLSEIGALAIEAEAAICLSYEDSSQSNKGKKVNLLLQLLTVAFMLIKCKGKLTDQLKHKAILETELLNLVENANEELIFLIVFLIDPNEEMVGFQDVMDKLKKQLLGGLHQLDVISIFGMPGNGKTTLAKKIYNDPTVVSHFHVRAMCHVTQVYSWRDLLLTILNDVLEPADRTKKGDDELATELRRVLLTKRFLILIDDVWDKTAWDYLRMCFQGSRNKSRIILTTRLYEVARYAKCNSEPHRLRLLTDDESWKLLQEELFHGQSFPCELGDVGLRIAKRCGGLPLSIVLVAGVLKEKKKKADCWKEVEESLSSHSIGSSEESMSIIGFSYKNLPNHLKPCFLYFGGFLRGKDIPVSKLSRVWLAEGIVEDSKEKGSEDAAQDYLKDLIRKKLVTDVEKRSNGKLKTCRVHDLLHQFCVEKAKQDNFLFWIHRGHGVDSISYPEKPEVYRLSTYSKWDYFAQLQQTGSSVRSLLFNASSDDYYPSMARDISFIINRFKLVKVLNLESINIGDTFPNELKSLIHMRYFAVRTSADSIPSSVSDLWNLETFVVNGLHRVLKLPCSLFKMFKLRHVHVNSRASFSLHDNMCESQLVNLETFSTPCLSPGEDAEKILRSMPNLRKLRCIVEGLLGYSTKGSVVRFPRLDFLHQLESLKRFSNSYPTKHPHEFNFPLNLRELTLSNFRLPWTQILTVGKLPNLEILKLLFRAFEGAEWEVKDSDFPELKYLKLDNLNIAEWSVMDDAFPKLERLVLTKCKKLEKIPCHFEDVASLESIEVNWCSWSVANSAQEFQTTQHEDMANYAFRVTIQPPDWETRSSH
ncbi:LOW QUALITY PROTEIN: uncharacterized protein LOC125814078 [Solanum verrucosum]|uniref:LOW QUALITY PROTEIN: uncharacterized protein LOC125814078 n=1 Tax=Solanum verrucosum TaxID=315347 RepID=UPI0020D0A2DA|nr:LOW QUALITY PROTEIN: uncharacterized protein LOC125814078 [Solanum verrucosum]